MLTNQHVLALEPRSFVMPAWKYLYRTVDVPIEEAIYLDRDIELGVARLGNSVLDIARVISPCLSTRAVKQGEVLRATSSAYGKFPPVSATLVVSDARPLMRLDPTPHNGNPYSATTIIAILSAGDAGRIGPGSSGAPVLNRQGELVGLVWTGREINENRAEVWVTPVSSWLEHLQGSKISKGYLQAILDLRCRNENAALWADFGE